MKTKSDMDVGGHVNVEGKVKVDGKVGVAAPAIAVPSSVHA